MTKRRRWKRLPALPTGPDREALRATGTDGNDCRSLRPACAGIDFPCGCVTTNEEDEGGIRDRQNAQQPLELLGVADDCEPLRTHDEKIRPRGGMVDTRDLKSLGA